VTAVLAEGGVSAAQRIAALCPGSIWPTKRWTADGFAAVAERWQRGDFGPCSSGRRRTARRPGGWRSSRHWAARSSTPWDERP